MRITLTETLVGFGIAIVLGIGLGTLLGRVQWLEQAMRPVIVASQVVPKVALIPLFIIWFGFGITSKIIIVAMIAFFPMLLNTILGVRSVDEGQKDVMKSLNASRWQTFRRLEYPSTLPYILAGMEVAIIFAVIGRDRRRVPRRRPGARLPDRHEPEQPGGRAAVRGDLLPHAVRIHPLPGGGRAEAVPHPVARLGDRQHDAKHMRRQRLAGASGGAASWQGCGVAGERYEERVAPSPGGRTRRGGIEGMERDTDTIDDERPERPLSPTTRRSFVGRSAGAFAAVSGGGMLLAACGGDDDNDAAGGGSASTSESSGGGGGGGGEVQVVNILPPQLGYAAELIADMDGYFKKEGLTVKVNTARGSAPAIQAILSGTALLSWVGWLESVIAIANRGAPIQAVAFTGRRSTLKLVSDKGNPMTTPQDLVGQRIGIPSEGGTSETTLDLMLANSGIDPKKVQRQVTGFTPGTFELIKRKRIAGFIIGGSQEQQFREAQPTSVFLETAKYVQDGLTYITSPDGVKNNKAQIEAYMRALKGAMLQIVDDGPEYTDTIKKLRSKYDFPELKSDTVAKYYLKYNTDNWMLDGRDKLLKVDKEKWQATYDAAVKVKAAKGGVDVQRNVVDGIT